MTEHRELPPSEWHGSAAITSTGSPIGVRTPQAVGEFYFDDSGPALYVANGLTNADWINVTTGTPSAPSKAVALPQYFNRGNTNTTDAPLRMIDDNANGESVKGSWGTTGHYFVVPFDNAVLTKAVLSVLGIAVSPGSVTFPLTFRFDVVRQDVSGSTVLGNLDFVIPSVGAPPIGVFNNSGGTTSNIRGLEVTAALALTKGDLIGVRYGFSTAGDRVNASRHARVVLRVEEQ